MSSLPGHLDHKSKLTILILTSLFAALTIWMVTPAPPTGFYWDDTWYLLMSEWVSGQKETQELAWTMLHSRQYPPLFSYAIYLSGSGLSEHSAAFVMNALFLAAGVGMAMIWFRKEGFSLPTMGLAAALVLLNPVALHWIPTLFSEHLFILISMTALALACTRSYRLRLWVLLGFVVGLSIATRSAGWALAAGLFAHLAVQRKFSCIPVFLIGMAISLASVPFLTAGLPEVRSNLDGIRETLGYTNWNYLAQQFSAIMLGWHKLWGSAVGAVLAAVICLPGLLLRLKANRPDAWYVLAYFAMLMVWPFPEHMDRFLWPLMPTLLVSGHEFFSLKWRVEISEWAPGLLVGLILAASIPSGFGISLSRLANPPGAELAELSRMPEWIRSEDRELGLEVLAARRQFLDDMQQIKETTGASFCIYSELPAMVTAQAQRKAFASPWNSLAEITSDMVECPYYYLIPSALPGTDATALETFANKHDELFRSMTPYETDGIPVLGVFLDLSQPVAVSD